MADSSSFVGGIVLSMIAFVFGDSSSYHSPRSAPVEFAVEGRIRQPSANGNDGPIARMMILRLRAGDDKSADQNVVARFHAEPGGDVGQRSNQRRGGTWRGVRWG